MSTVKSEWLRVRTLEGSGAEHCNEAIARSELHCYKAEYGMCAWPKIPLQRGELCLAFLFFFLLANWWVRLSDTGVQQPQLALKPLASAHPVSFHCVFQPFEGGEQTFLVFTDSTWNRLAHLQKKNKGFYKYLTK